MAIHLDHMIVPVRDKHAAAQRLAALLDVPWAESLGEFVAVFVNEGLTLDFAEREGFEGHHICFRVSDAEFDAIFGRIQAAGITYRSGPRGAPRSCPTARRSRRRCGSASRAITCWSPPARDR